jgi:hypothetical protein
MNVIPKVMQDLANSARQILVWDNDEQCLVWHPDAEEVVQVILYKHAQDLNTEATVHFMKMQCELPEDDNS